MKRKNKKSNKQLIISRISNISFFNTLV
jgi:hypothetical protein